MHADTAQRLLDLNREFYQTFGREFSATRQRLQPGVQRVLGTLQGDESILDLGCGNGELARRLARDGFAGRYLGLDFSLPLLEAARGLPDNYRFAAVDLAGGEWGQEPCSLVFCFAALHHIPGTQLRLSIVKKVRALLPPGGHFIHSNWQFLNSARLRARIQPWDRAGLSDRDVDPGDFLLDWRNGGQGLRYVHHFSEEELAGLAAQTGFVVRESFLSDGETGRLGLYQIWEKV
jgi:SAM-dependent methyltransferase